MESLSSSLLMMVLVVERDSEMVITEAVSPVTTTTADDPLSKQRANKFDSIELMKFTTTVTQMDGHTN